MVSKLVSEGGRTPGFMWQAQGIPPSTPSAQTNFLSWSNTQTIPKVIIGAILLIAQHKIGLGGGGSRWESLAPAT